MQRQYLSQRAIEILRAINNYGYYLPKSESDLNVLRGLKAKEISPIHIAKYKGKRIAYLEGYNGAAMKVFMERYKINYLSTHKLAQLRYVFGLRGERYKYKPYKKKKRSEEYRNTILDQFYKT